MADRHGKCIRGIFLRDFGKIEEHLQHLLNLHLGRFPVADNRLFHLESGIFIYRQAGVDPGHDCRPPSLPELQRALDVLGEKDVFHGNHFGLVAFDDLGEPSVDPLQMPPSFTPFATAEILTGTFTFTLSSKLT